MASVGDIISELSTKTTLTDVAPTYTSIAVVLGQYNSLTVTVRCDKECTLDVSWSDDGDNFDYLESYTIPASTGVSGVQEFLVVGNKWVKMLLTKTEGGNATFTRMTVYGVVTNNNTQSILVPQAGSKISSLNIANFPYDSQGILTDTYQPFRTVSLRGWSAGTAGTYTSSDYDMLAVSLNTIGNIIVPVSESGLFVRCTGTTLIYDGSLLYDSHPTRIPQGVQCCLEWTCNIDNSVGNLMLCMAGYGNPYTEGLLYPNDGIFIGGSSAGLVDTIVLYYVANTIIEEIPQSSWNVDKFNGTSNEASSLVLSLLQINSFRAYVIPSVMIIFSILDLDGKYKPAHIINLRDTTNKMVEAWSNPCVGLFALNSQYTNGSYAISVGPTLYASAIKFSGLDKAIPTYREADVLGAFSVATGATVWLALRNNDGMSTILYESALVKVKTLSVNGLAAVNQGRIFIKGYINAVNTGGSFSAPSDKTCTTYSTNTTGITITPNVTKDAFALTVLSGTANFFDLDKYNIWLRQGESLTVQFAVTSLTTPLLVDTAMSFAEYR